MNSRKIQVMVKGAMLASIYGVLGIINVYTGTSFDILFSYVMVIGTVWYTMNYDYRAGLMVVLVTAIVLFMVGDLFFTFFSTLTLLLGVYYGWCRKHNISISIQKWGLRGISAIKNLLVFYLLGNLLGLQVYQEGMEIYHEMLIFLPLLKDFITPVITLIVMWIFLFMSEAYIVMVYSDIFIKMMSKSKRLN